MGKPKAIRRAIMALTPSLDPVNVWADGTITQPNSQPIPAGQYVLIEVEQARDLVHALEREDGRTRLDPSARAKRKPTKKPRKTTKR